MKIALIDDHKIILEGYKAILISKKIEVGENIELLSSLADAYEYVLEQFKKNNPINFFIIDYSMPSCSKYKMNDGTDLINCIRDYFPNAKIVLLSSLSSPLLIFDIIKKTEPNGFWLKSDIDDRTLINYINLVCKDETIYSESVQKSFEHVSNYAKVLDENNRKILLLLDKGIKTKYLPDFIPLSLDTINHRKAKIKFSLGVDSKDDYILLKKAHSLGLL